MGLCQSLLAQQFAGPDGTVSIMLVNRLPEDTPYLVIEYLRESEVLFLLGQLGVKIVQNKTIISYTMNRETIITFLETNVSERHLKLKAIPSLDVG